jgi:RNA polymerase sigma factor (sigma-70 family)
MEFEEVAETVYREFSKHVYEYLRRRVEGDDIAQDLHQKVFERLFLYRSKRGQITDLIRRRDSGEDIGEGLRIAVYGAARDVYAEYYRQRIKKPIEESLDDKTPAGLSTPNPFDGVKMREVRAKLIQALLELELKCRKILYLCYIKNLRYQEIAEELDIVLGTVKSTLHRCKKELRELIEERYPELIVD